ncbi:MAG: ribonuclease D [Pirellulaceae bacterium]
MQYEHLTDQRQLSDFCNDVADAPIIAFDTEFVSEETYRPQLCLIQVAVAGRVAIIDPLSIEDVSSFWELLAAPGHETLVHAGRQEFQFCTTAIGKRPAGWFDVQLAAGFVGMEYPAAYSTLIARLLGRSLSKGETRTNWHRRPLSSRQLEYAANDVLYLQPIHAALHKRIDQLQRGAWLEEEFESWQRQVEEADKREPWRRVSGIASLRGARQLAIARELWRWREEQAEARNCPPKRVLRDDLIVELSRRQTSEIRRIRAIRGLERRNLQRHLTEIADRIDRASKLDDASCPRPLGNARQNVPQLTLLGQFLSVALGSICRSVELAPNLVGTVQDLRDLVAFRLEVADPNTKTPPNLARGWRAGVIGHAIDELLDGKVAIRVRDPLAENPLDLERSDP